MFAIHYSLQLDLFWECLYWSSNESIVVVYESNLMVSGMTGLGLVVICSLPGSMMIGDDLSVI